MIIHCSRYGADRRISQASTAAAFLTEFRLAANHRRRVDPEHFHFRVRPVKSTLKPQFLTAIGMRKLLLGLAGAAIIFICGMVFQRKEIFPYRPISAAVQSLRKAIYRSHTNPGAILKSQYSQSAAGDSVKDLDTGLLPLKIVEFKVASRLPMATPAGGITLVNDSVIIVDRLGNVYHYKDGTVAKCDFPKLPNHIEDFITGADAELNETTFRVHDVEFVPSEKALAISHEYYDKEAQGTRLAVSLIGIDTRTLQPRGSWKTIFLGDLLQGSIYAGLGGGGRMTSRSDRKLLLTAGDYNHDSVTMESAKVAQDPNSTFGKIFEIDLATGTRRIISLGHRNPQGLTIATDGRIFSTEHGPAGGDELNLIQEGANYGWPNVTLGTRYSTYHWPLDPVAGEHRGYTLPFFAWVPSIGASNLIQVKNFHQRWNGDLLVASLKAASLYRLRCEDGRVIYSEPIWLGHRLRDLAETSDGSIVIWTDDGSLLFVRVDEDKLAKNRRMADNTTPLLMASCMSCHHFGPTNPDHPAPSLSGLIGRKIASDNFPRYSPALKSVDGVWSATRLRKFLLSPSDLANGTMMPKPDLGPEDIDRIVEFLETTRL